MLAGSPKAPEGMEVGGEGTDSRSGFPEIHLVSIPRKGMDLLNYSSALRFTDTKSRDSEV